MPVWITPQVCFTGAGLTPEQWREISTAWNVTVVVNLRAEAQDSFAHPLPHSYLWLPVIDHADPTLEQLLMGAQFIGVAVRANQRVLVHCKMGLGRSPTLAAAYLVWSGLSVAAAMEALAQAAAPLLVKPIANRYLLNEFSAFCNRDGGRQATHG